MNFRQLKYFVKVVEAGNMTRAAEQLHVAQPALGMQIRQMEEELGVALLNRHSRGVEPTRAGALLHERALRIIQMLEDACREVSNCDRDGSESIRLGMTPALMLVVGPEIAINARDRIPQVFLSLSEEMSHVLVETLTRGEIDIALAYDTPDLPHLKRTPMFREDLLLVTLPGPPGGQPISFAEAMEETLAMPEAGDTVRELVVRTAREQGLEPTIGFEVRSIAAIKNLVLRGMAAAILPLASVLEEVKAGKLGARPITSPALRRTLFVAAASQRRPLRHEIALIGVIRASLSCLTEVLGPLHHPLSPNEP